jgi:phospholipid/cholesterol/gamma-HCH transport system permease protein
MLERLLAYLIEWFWGMLTLLGDMALMLARSLKWMVKPPYRWHNLCKQLEFVGVKSLSMVVFAGFFTGMVMALQAFYGFRKFGGTAILGGVVALSLARELGPVLTALMVTARAGSGMAAELGTMKVTEQVDALLTMAVHPLHYLVAPRLLAGVIMVPLLTVVFIFMGMVGGFVVSVFILGSDPGIYVQRTLEMLKLPDLKHGLFKSAVFGLLVTLNCCYQGLQARGGAEGVGSATTLAVVYSGMTILAGDYVLTALLF